MRLSVTARIALLSIALALASNLALVSFLWRQTQDVALAATKREMIEQSDALLMIWRQGGLKALIPAVKGARPPGDNSLLVAIVDDEGRRLVGDAPAQLSVALGRAGFRVAPLSTDADWADRDIGFLSIRSAAIGC